MHESSARDLGGAERERHPVGFEHFFRSQYPGVVRIAAAFVRDPHLAEDIAQEVLISAARRFPDPSSSDHAVAWVRTAVAHVSLNAIRGQRRRQRRQERMHPEGSQIGPEETVVDREAAAELKTALSRMPRRQATVLVLRHSGLSYSEVADAMGVGIGEVGTMLRRAESSLRKEVQRGTR